MIGAKNSGACEAYGITEGAVVLDKAAAVLPAMGQRWKRNAMPNRKASNQFSGPSRGLPSIN